MPREPEPSINERHFIVKALQEGVRLDGRALHAFRDLSISLSEEEYGVADVQLGPTRVLTRISASLAAPAADRKFDGTFTITTELSPLASAAFETSSRPSDLETHLSTTLDTLIRRSNALPTESLCLLAGKSIWAVRATVHVLAHSGSLVTACSLSILAALLHFRVPASEVRGGESRVFTTKERDPAPLALLHHPVAVELAVYEATVGTEGSDKLVFVTDPTLAEQQSAAAEVLIGANREGEVVLVEKRGGVEVDAVLLLGAIKTAVKDARKLVDGAVKGAIEEDRQRRRNEGDDMREKELRAENDRES